MGHGPSAAAGRLFAVCGLGAGRPLCLAQPLQVGGCCWELGWRCGLWCLWRQCECGAALSTLAPVLAAVHRMLVARLICPRCWFGWHPSPVLQGDCPRSSGGPAGRTPVQPHAVHRCLRLPDPQLWSGRGCVW